MQLNFKLIKEGNNITNKEQFIQLEDTKDFLLSLAKEEKDKALV